MIIRRLHLAGLAFVGLLQVVSCGDHSPARLLRAAAEDGDTVECARLVAEGADVDAVDERGITALGYAVYGHQFDTARILIERGADVNHADRDANTPLLYTGRAPFGHGGYPSETHSAREAVAKLLLERGADIRHSNAIGDTALHRAVLDRNVGLTRLLLMHGADLSARDGEGFTAIDIARFPAFAPNNEMIAVFTKTTTTPSVGQTTTSR